MVSRTLARGPYFPVVGVGRFLCVTWLANDHEQLAANREAIIVKLRARLRVFENRYEMSSFRVHAAIDQGIIRETAEVTSWLMAWHAYGALLDERQAIGGPPPNP